MWEKLTSRDAGLLALRLALGAIFLAHGVMKLQNMGGTVEWFSSLAFPVSVAPAAFAYLAMILEVGGGVALLAGVFAEWAGLLLAVEMLFAIYLVKLPGPFVNGYTYELILLAAAFAIYCLGAGGYSLKKYLPQ